MSGLERPLEPAPPDLSAAAPASRTSSKVGCVTECGHGFFGVPDLFWIGTMFLWHEKRHWRNHWAMLPCCLFEAPKEVPKPPPLLPELETPMEAMAMAGIAGIKSQLKLR
jgi:hypothetical protein